MKTVIPVSDMDKQACFSLLPKSNDTAMTSELTQVRIFSDTTHSWLCMYKHCTVCIAVQLSIHSLHSLCGMHVFEQA